MNSEQAADRYWANVNKSEKPCHCLSVGPQVEFALTQFNIDVLSLADGSRFEQQSDRQEQRRGI